MAKIYYYEKIITIPIYHGRLVIIFTDNTYNIRKRHPELNDPQRFMNSHFTFGPVRDKNNNIWEGYYLVFNPKSSPITAGVIAHESCHAVDELFNQRDVKLNIDPGNEHYTYMVQFIADKVEECLKNAKKHLCHKKRKDA